MINRLLISIIYILFGIPILSQAQIQVSDYSEVEDSRIEKYDSSYFQPNNRINYLPVMNGLVGHSLIFLKEPISTMGTEIFQNGIQQKFDGAFKKYLFQYCLIKKVIDGKFYLSCLGDSIIYEPSLIDNKDIVILEGFEKFKSKHLGKKYHSLSTLKFLSLESKEIEVQQGQVLTLSDIKLVNLGSQFGVGFEFLSQNQKFTIGLTFYDRYIEFGGNPSGKINFSFFDDSFKLLRIVDEKLYSSINKSFYKKYILKGEIVVGMTEKEIRIVLGMPNGDKVSSGYEKVLIYKGGGTTHYLYMKGKKLVKISQI